MAKKAVTKQYKSATFYFPPLRYSHEDQCSGNCRFSIKSKPSCSQYISAHFGTKFAYIVVL